MEEIMRRSKNQIIYSALPGQFITFSSNRSDKENCKRANQCVINVRKWNTKRIEKKDDIIKIKRKYAYTSNPRL